MKVWHQDITACWMCPYYNFPIGPEDTGFLCKADDHSLPNRFMRVAEIDKNCEFNKSLSKEVLLNELDFHIESKGEEGDIYFRAYENDKKAVELQLYENSIVGILLYDYDVVPPMVFKQIGNFRGRVDSVIELEFIIKQLSGI